MNATALAAHAGPILEQLGGTPPKVTEYANGHLIAFRNNEGDRLGLWIEPNTKPETIEHRIHEVFKVKAENIARPETMAKFMKSVAPEASHNVPAVNAPTYEIVQGPTIVVSPSGKHVMKSAEEIRKHQEAKKSQP